MLRKEEEKRRKRLSKNSNKTLPQVGLSAYVINKLPQSGKVRALQSLSSDWLP